MHQWENAHRNQGVNKETCVASINLSCTNNAPKHHRHETVDKTHGIRASLKVAGIDQFDREVGTDSDLSLRGRISSLLPPMHGMAIHIHKT